MIYVRHEKAGSIGVDDVREQIVNDAGIRPYSSPYKIYIVDQAELLTPQAQNALLKTIEEPPEYAVIFLLTTNSDAFLPTILSRCTVLKLKPLYDQVIRGYLIEHNKASAHQADVCTAFARGNLGKAIALSSSEEFMRLQEIVLNLMKRGDGNAGIGNAGVLKGNEGRGAQHQRLPGLYAAVVQGYPDVQGHQGHLPVHIQGRI